MIRNMLIFFLLLMITQLSAQNPTTPTTEKPCFVGSTLFMLYNLVDDPEPPHYYQLNFGYRITPKDVVSLELITWRYYEPLGVPLGRKGTASNFPGHVQAYGIGLAYKRFLWKNAYAQVHATALRQNYRDEADRKIQQGFQLFNTIRVGYQFRFFDDRVFLEPSIACTFWPVNTNLPTSFQTKENQWNTYFLGEPGLHFGFNF